MKVSRPMSFMLTFLWIGFVAAISFMEAWLKFKAPGVTLTVGLGIGQLVFGALNKVEWLLASIILVQVLAYISPKFIQTHGLFLLVILILVLQTFWLLPALDKRVSLRLAQVPVPNSNLHLIYVIGEIIKVTALIFYGLSHLSIRKHEKRTNH